MEELKELLLLYRNSNTDFGIALEQRIIDKYAELEAEVAYMEQLTSAKMEAEAKWVELEAENKRLKEEAIAGQKAIEAMERVKDIIFWPSDDTIAPYRHYGQEEQIKHIRELLNEYKKYPNKPVEAICPK